jgi:hypothetical protein
VLDTVASKDLEGAIIHLDREVYRQFTLALFDAGNDAVRELEPFADLVNPSLYFVEGVGI